MYSLYNFYNKYKEVILLWKKLLISFLTLFVTLNISTATNANTNDKEKYSKLST